MKSLALWDGFVVLSEAHKNDLNLRYGDRNNIYVIPHPAVDIVPDTDSTKRDPDLALIVCRLENQKRLQDAIHAFAHVLEKRPTARLEIYGTGSKLQEWTDLVKSLNISNSVLFMGYEPRPERQYERASVFIMTSLFEAQPLSLLEALAHGCPIVSYDIKYGPAEMVRQGSNGFLSPEGNIKTLSEDILRVFSSDIATMSASSIDLARQFSVPIFLDKWCRLFESVKIQKAQRVSIISSSLEVQRVSAVGASPIAIALSNEGIGVRLRASHLRIGGRLIVTALYEGADRPAGLRVAVRIHSTEGEVQYLPNTLSELEDDNQFDLNWTIAEDDLSRLRSNASLFYEVTWNNDQRLLEIPLDAELFLNLSASNHKDLAEGAS
nr:glycosyltransferase [Arthrobacter jiangjiafuii]